MKKLTRSLLAVAAFALLAGQVGAQVININWHKYATPGVNTVTNAPGQGVLDDSETIGVWNNVGLSAMPSNLVDSASNTTAVAVNVGYHPSWYIDSIPNLAVLTEYLYLKSASATNIVTQPIVFSNLTAGATYDIAFMGTGNSPQQDSRFTIGESSKIIAPVDITTPVWTEGENYVLFSDVEADADGVISGEWSNVTGQYAALSGIQIAKKAPPAPEGPPVMTCEIGEGGLDLALSNLYVIITYEIEGATTLVGGTNAWTTLRTTNGVSSADFTFPMTEPNQFFRLKWTP